MSTLREHSAFRGQYGQFKSAQQSRLQDEEKPELLPWQVPVFTKLRNERHVILNAPTGWGKSVVMVMLILWKLIRNPKLRCIITVPQTVIGGGFTRPWTLKVAGKIVRWLVQHDLCSPGKNKVGELVRFLRGPHSFMGDRVLLCTHATLANAYRKLRKRRKLDLFKNVLLWVDEAHHAMNAQVRDSKETVSNSIGGLVKHCMKIGHVGLATATFMRGDMRHILPDDLAQKFTRYDIPYDEYFSTSAPVESFEFNILCGETHEALASILKRGKRPTIIYLPKRQSRYATDCKRTEVKQIKKLLKGLKVLDLVTPEGREHQKAQLQGGDFDVIIALDMCKEGFDWVKAERSIIIGERHSVTEMIQMIGRLFRRSPGKKHAEVFQVLPALVPDSKTFKDQRNDILTVIFSAMLLEDVFCPLPVGKGKKRGLRLASVVSNTNAWQSLQRDFFVACQGKTFQQSLKLAPSILKAHDIPKPEWKNIWKTLWTRWALKSRQARGLSVKNIDFSVLKNEKLDDGILELCSGLCGAMTFNELREVIGKACITHDEMMAIAERLAKENGGKLPSFRWLCKNGRSDLAYRIIRRPDLFKHLEQEWAGGMSEQEAVKLAETLAKKNGGRIPTIAWLIKNGHSALNQRMYKHPDLFKHLEQEWAGGISEQEAVKLAETLAKKNGGRLPCTHQIIKSGFKQLPGWIRAKPSLFKHLRQIKVGMSDQQAVKLAEKLARKNGGELPAHAWLIKNGHYGLSQRIRKKADLFKHLEQGWAGGTSTQEAVKLAEKLAKQNGGKIPCGAWLVRNGHSGLNRRLVKYPKLFKHLEQVKKVCMTDGAAVKLANKLAAENGGRLPNTSWLRKNGHKNLSGRIYAKPKLFKHLEQTKLDTWGRVLA